MTTTAAAAGTRRHTGTYPAEPRQVGLARAAMAGWLGGCPRADEAVLVAPAARRRSMRRSPRCWTARSRPFAEIRKRTLAHDCTDATELSCSARLGA